MGPRVELTQPAIGDDERAAVMEVMAAPIVAYDDRAKRFERAVADHLGHFAHALAVASGTAALHLALAAARVGHGDEILLPSMTFIAPANAVRYVGATPVFLDVEPDFCQLDPAALRDWLHTSTARKGGQTVNRYTGRSVRGVLPVDLLGHPVDLDAVREIADDYELLVIEDAAQAFGARLRDQGLGGKADVLCLSFNANKIITTAGGGMLLTNDARIAERASFLAGQAKKSGSGYDHPEVGFNYLMGEIPAAIGLRQLRRLDQFLASKRRIASFYGARLRGTAGLELPSEAEWARSSWWLYTVMIDETRFGMSASELGAHLESHGIASRRLFTPMHVVGAHLDCPATACPNAERLAARGLVLPCSVGLTASDQDRVVRAIADAAASSYD